MRLSPSICWLGLSVAGSSAATVRGRESAASSNSSSSSTLPSRTIYQFPTNGSWAENIAVRANGNLLVTLFLPAAELWQIPPAAPDGATRVHTFAGATSLLGIAETAPDVFVLAAADYSSGTANGTSALWEVRFPSDDDDDDAADATVRRVTGLPDALVANGVAAAPDGSAALVADSQAGLVWRVDTATGAVATAVSVPEMASPLGTNTSSRVGINGIKVVVAAAAACDGDDDDSSDGGAYLYFDNSDAASVYRVPITAAGYADDAAGAAVETVADLRLDGETFIDDFTFGPDGAAIWAMTNHNSTVCRVDVRTGESIVVASSLFGDTAGAFGRTDDDAQILYVVTSGEVDSAPVEPGKVVALDTSGFR